MLKDFFGFGALSEAFSSIQSEEYRRVFVVTSRSGWQRFNPNGTRPFFAERDIELFSDFSNNPNFKDIQKGTAKFRRFRPDLIVAIGGGSPIDVAKVIKAEAFTKEPFDPEKPDTLKPSGDGPPLIAIATTAGSGSEATQFAVFYRGVDKVSLSHPSLRPEMAVVDPEMSYSMPPGQTACTGLDAIAQGIEAYWASATTPEAQILAKTAIGYAIPNLYNAVTKPGPGNRYNMAMAAYLAGQAINTTRTTLPHALGYHLTKRYNLPHGHAVAMTIPHCFLINMDESLKINTPAGREGHRKNMRDLFAMLGQKDAEDCFEFWRNLMRACGLAATFTDIGLTTREQVEALVKTVNPERLKNHPVEVGPEYLIDLFLRRP